MARVMLSDEPPEGSTKAPEAAVAEFAGTLKAYHVSSVRGDRYAGEWPRERFGVHGIKYEPADLNRSELYLAFLPLLNSGRLDLLDCPRMITQFVALERRTARSGRDSIDHAPGGHDDLANAVAGVASLMGSAPLVLNVSMDTARDLQIRWRGLAGSTASAAT